jgi:hypothetical protein
LDGVVGVALYGYGSVDGRDVDGASDGG